MSNVIQNIRANLTRRAALRQRLKIWRSASLGIALCVYGNNACEPTWAQEPSSAFPFQDDFAGKTLHPDWSVQNEDLDRWTLLDDEYLFLISTHGSSNVFQLKHVMPQKFEIEARISGLFARGQCFSLKLDQDTENYIEIGICGAGGPRRIYFQKSQGGSSNAFSEHIDSTGEVHAMKLVRSGPEIAGYYTKGGEGGWIEVGTHYFIRFNGHMSLAAWNEAVDIPEGGFRVDYVRVKDLD